MRSKTIPTSDLNVPLIPQDKKNNPLCSIYNKLYYDIVRLIFTYLGNSDALSFSSTSKEYRKIAAKFILMITVFPMMHEFRVLTQKYNAHFAGLSRGEKLKFLTRQTIIHQAEFYSLYSFDFSRKGLLNHISSNDNKVPPVEITVECRLGSVIFFGAWAVAYLIGSVAVFTDNKGSMAENLLGSWLFLLSIMPCCYLYYTKGEDIRKKPALVEDYNNLKDSYNLVARKVVEAQTAQQTLLPRTVALH